MLQRWLIFAGLPAVFSIRLLAQQSPVAFLPPLPLGKGDVIGVTIEEEADLTKRLTISASGDIVMPLLKAPLHVEGLTPDAAATLIGEAYINQRLLLRPVVEVTPLEYHSYLVRVTGEVVHPMEFQALEPVSLLSVLARAGGPGPKSSGNIEVTTHDRKTGAESKQTIPIRALIDDADPKYNLILRGGEEVNLPAGHDQP